jgi:glucose/arabinose dehydrogenase
MSRTPPLVALALLALSGCLERASLPAGAPYGPDPALPQPNKKPIPTVKVARATGWPADGAPTPADGFEVRAFARGLDHPRWLYVLPNGDVLVAETNAPPRPEEGKGFKGKVMKLLMKRNGSAVPSPDRITLLRDVDGDGVLEVRAPFLTDLHSPFGMALVGDRFLVADTDAVVSFPYREGETRITARRRRSRTFPPAP